MRKIGRRRVKPLAMLLCLMLMLAGGSCEAWAEGSGSIAIPAQTTGIEAYAFYGCKEIKEAVLPDGLQTIGEYAFYGTGVQKVSIPDTVKFIGEGAFQPGTEIRCGADSYAAQWAKENGCTRAPNYYALLIGQEYTDSSMYLPGCFRDVDSMKRMLEAMPGTPYEISVGKDLTADGIAGAIGEAFAGAAEGDVCLFYYSGHGCYSDSADMLGALQGTDSRIVTIGRLKRLLDMAPGEKIVIFDSCYSGAAIASRTADESTEADLEKINQAIVQQFSSVQKSNLAQKGYYVITAANANEESVSVIVGSGKESVYFGAFTYGLLLGSGYDEIAEAQMTEMGADTDGDRRISLSEAYQYAYARALTYSKSQHAQCYPAGSNFLLWGR